MFRVSTSSPYFYVEGYSSQLKAIVKEGLMTA